VFPLPREQFTVALGSDFDTQPRRGRGCCGRKSSCLRGCEARCRGRRSSCSCCRSCCCCCWRRPICTVRPICVCTTVALVLLAVVALSVAVFLAVFLVVTRPSGQTSFSQPVFMRVVVNFYLPVPFPLPFPLSSLPFFISLPFPFLLPLSSLSNRPCRPLPSCFHPSQPLPFLSLPSIRSRPLKSS